MCVVCEAYAEQGGARTEPAAQSKRLLTAQAQTTGSLRQHVPGPRGGEGQAGRTRERLLPRGDPGAELRRKHESTLQRKERKGVPRRGNCRPEGMEVGPWIHGVEPGCGTEERPWDPSAEALKTGKD